MTSRGPGRASRSPEMEEKEQLRRQIRLLQGLIDDYKNHHGSAAAFGTSAAGRWQPSAYTSSRGFGSRYTRSSRRAFPPQHGPEWRKKYSLVNRPPASLDPSTDGATHKPLEARGSQEPAPQEYVLERQVQLNPDQNMVIKIKPPSKPGSAGVAGALRGSLEEREDPSWSIHRPQDGEGEPPVGQWQPSRPARKGSRNVEEPLLVCQREPSKTRVVKSVNVSDSPSEPRRTVSESAIAVKPHSLSSALSQRSCTALARKVSSHATVSCVAQLLEDRTAGGHHDQLAPADLLTDPLRSTSGSRLGSRANKFRKNNYKWVAASAKSPRASRRALSPRAATENVCKATPGTAEAVEKPQPQTDADAKPRKPTMPAMPGISPSKYKWKASSPSASSSSSLRWQSETGSKDHTSQLSPVPSRSPSVDREAVETSVLKPLFGETPLSAYKVKSRTKIIRRRGSTSLPGDKKSSPPSTLPARTQYSLRRRQILRGKNSPVLKKTPNKGLMQVTRHRLYRLPQSRTPFSTKDAPSPLASRSPAASKVFKTRYRIVKKSPSSPLGLTQCPQSGSSWRARRLSSSRSMVLNRLRPAVSSGGKMQLSSPRWRSRGYRCIGGVLYRVSANKLSKTSGRLADGSSRPGLRAGRLELTSSCSRSLASRAVQRSLAIVRQARQRRRKRTEEYCMYYNRFGRCNRGERCPYIHDPEKVAVCTRFLRGTCKKTDGTCPFSHQVSKEKMPVCSYFLKGICSNNSCPYSHVYVSRKAAVCTDFLKGYCPLGAKCKKKHTLLCPDFSRRGVCPRGTQCQLLHRNQKRPCRRAATSPVLESSHGPRSRASTAHGPRKSSASQRPTRNTPSSPTSVAAGSASPPSSPQGLAISISPLSSKAPPSSSSPSTSSSPTPSPPSPPLSLDQEDSAVQKAASVWGAGKLSKLPSFISLRSTPSPAGQPRARTSRNPLKDSGKPLHIKPRL